MSALVRVRPDSQMRVSSLSESRRNIHFARSRQVCARGSLKTQTQSEALLVKSGAKNPRLIAAMAAGEASGSLVSTWEADDWAKYGQVLEAFFSGGGDAVMMEISAEDSPISSWSSTYVDIPR
jgi:hypothetical protein